MLLVKTESGQQVMKDRSVPLTPRQRSALILVDGKRTVAQLLAAAAGMMPGDIDKLIELGLVADAAPQQTAAQAAAVHAQADAVVAHKQRTPHERYAEAYPLASQLTASLGLRGFRLNLAVEGAGTYEQLLEIAPRIREAVGPEKYQALNDR